MISAAAMGGCLCCMLECLELLLGVLMWWRTVHAGSVAAAAALLAPSADTDVWFVRSTLTPRTYSGISYGTCGPCVRVSPNIGAPSLVPQLRFWLGKKPSCVHFFVRVAQLESPACISVHATFSKVSTSSPGWLFTTPFLTVSSTCSLFTSHFLHVRGAGTRRLP